MATDRPDLLSIPCATIPRLRVGRRVPEHVYLQRGPEPSDGDEPLFTCPAHIARLVVDGLEALRWLNLNPVVPVVNDQREDR